MNKRFLPPFLTLLSVLSLSACNSKGSAKIGMGAQALPVPDAPSALVLTIPVSSPSFLPNPTITVSGVNNGDGVSLFSDASCTTQVSSETPSVGTSVAVTASGLALGPHTIFARTKNSYGVNSDCSSVSVAYTRVLCPTDYVEVPTANGVPTFCMMRYEAKCENASGIDCAPATGAPSATKIAASKEAGLPWVSISQTEAKTACTNLNSIHGLTTKFDLISNSEWMVAAKNIEANPLNWTGGIGVGYIHRGNSDGTVLCDSTVSNVDANCSILGADPTLKRTHLIGADLVWDLAGNASEWVDWGRNIGGPLTASPTTCLDQGFFYEFADVTCPALAAGTYLPTDTRDALDNMLGRFYGGPSGTTVRGGQVGYNEDAGIYSLNLALPNVQDSYTGFRCVYRP